MVRLIACYFVVQTMVVQRIYESELDFETVRNKILKEENNFQFKNDLRLLSFNLTDFPDNLLQLTPRQNYLMVHGLKPYDYLRDLLITKTLAANLCEIYSAGISFKLFKEVIRSSDKDEIIKREQLMTRWYRSALNFHRSGGEEKLQSFLNALWKRDKTNEELRKELAEELNNALSYAVCRNGFCWKPDGTLLASERGLYYQRAPELMKVQVKLLIENGFV
jgi:hypothetical protein